MSEAPAALTRACLGSQSLVLCPAGLPVRPQALPISPSTQLYPGRPHLPVPLLRTHLLIQVL